MSDFEFLRNPVITIIIGFMLVITLPIWFLPACVLGISWCVGTMVLDFFDEDENDGW